MTIANWLYKSIAKLSDASIESSRLDCLLLLEHVLTKNRAWLLANGEFKLTKKQLADLEVLLNNRIDRVPIAYLVGNKEFYGYSFIVTPDVLIPRPESESFLELLTKFASKKDSRLLDVGTGSGALAISAKLLIPELEVYACDISEEALKVAKNNAKILGAKINFKISNLLSAYDIKFDYIFANLPYVPLGHKVSPEVHKEPEIAVFADSKGLDLIFRLADQANNKLRKSGYIFIESLVGQQDEICDYYQKAGFKFYEKAGFVQVFRGK